MPCPFSSPMRIDCIDYISNGRKHYVKRVINVPCGKCEWCLKRKASQWEMRIQHELQTCISAYFVTLTYNDDNLPQINGTPCFSKDDIQKFFKRLRKNLKLTLPIKYLLVAEYGDLDSRPHYHAIIFNLPFSNYEETTIALTNIWSKGYCSSSILSLPRIRYVLQYYTTNPREKNLYKYPECYPFLLTSKRPAIGADNLSNLSNYINRNADLTVHYDGRKYLLSDYHKRKLISKFNQSFINKINTLQYERKNNSTHKTLNRVANSCKATIELCKKRLAETEGLIHEQYKLQLETYEKMYDVINDSLLHAPSHTFDTTEHIKLINKLKSCLI